MLDDLDGHDGPQTVLGLRAEVLDGVGLMHVEPSGPRLGDHVEGDVHAGRLYPLVAQDLEQGAGATADVEHRGVLAQQRDVPFARLLEDAIGVAPEAALKSDVVEALRRGGRWRRGRSITRRPVSAAIGARLALAHLTQPAVEGVHALAQLGHALAGVLQAGGGSDGRGQLLHDRLHRTQLALEELEVDGEGV